MYRIYKIKFLSFLKHESLKKYFYLTSKLTEHFLNFQSHDYFGAEGQEKIDFVERLQILCQSFDLMKLNEINEKIEGSEVEQAKCLVNEKVGDFIKSVCNIIIKKVTKVQFFNQKVSLTNKLIFFFVLFIWNFQLDEVRAKLDEERAEVMKAAKSTNGATNGKSNGGAEKEWSYEDLQILIKAVNMFPAGTVNRYVVCL